MAHLTIDQIHKIIKAPEPEFITLAKKKSKRLDVLVNGFAVPEYLAKIEGYENNDQFTLRKKFAGNVKHVFENLLRPIDKVFSAKGGSKIYGTGKSEVANEKIRSLLSDIKDGFSIKQWIENIQANKYYSDPSGLVFFEWTEDDAFPSIKPISTIRNYETSGRDVEWVLFEPEIRKDSTGRQLRGEFFRFVNGESDFMFHKDGESILLLEDETFENPWKRCPAIVNSDILNFTLAYHDSPLDNVVELADKYLRGQSTRNIYEQVLMWPVAWMYAQKCASCKGTGEKEGKTCESCNGSQQSMKRDVSNMLILNTPKDSDAPTIAPDVAGFGQVELEPFTESREELKWVGDVMNFTMWGSTHETAENNTATAAFLDVQPVQDKQGKFTSAFEDMEKKMTDFIGEFYLASAYKPDGTSINWGRRYLMESPDKVLEKYMEAKEKDAPKVSLDHLLNQYYQSEFMNDHQTLSIMIKGMKVEPFVHKSDEQVQALAVQGKDYTNKVYFNEWWATLEEMEILTTNTEKLREKLNKFTQGKLIKDEES
jgi:hypothetical protein